MSNLFVKFPGLAGNYISTPDVNLLDADTAHLQQSVGLWSGTVTLSGPTLEVDPATMFGNSAALWTVTATGGNPRGPVSGDGLSSIKVSPSTELSVGIDLRSVQSSVALRREVKVREFDAAGANLGDTTIQALKEVTDDTYEYVTGTFTTKAATEWLAFRVDYREVGSNGFTVTGHQFVVGAVCVRTGSDPTFVPSLRIVGTLFETITPADMPIAFAGDGTPLTVGEGWAGDGYRYIRHDGPDDTAPVVADFNPANLP